MNQVIHFFREFKDDLKSIGVGSFGPIDIQKNSETYGYITSTPKIGWQNFNFVGSLKEEFNVSVAWTTDVNAACYGEYIAGAGKYLNNVVYYTVGTGVGGGAIQNGKFIEGITHPEMGHMLVVPQIDDLFEGTCPFHHNCLEGMASGPAIEKRIGKKGQEIPTDHHVWDVISAYIAQCAYNTTLMLSPEVIIFGGGVMKQKHLIDRVRNEFQELLNGYTQTPSVTDYLVTPRLRDDAGITGCLALARQLGTK